MSWTVNFSRKAAKQAAKLNKSIQAALYLLVDDLKCKGPLLENIGKIMESSKDQKLKTGVIAI